MNNTSSDFYDADEYECDYENAVFVTKERYERDLAEAQRDAERYRWLRGQAEQGCLGATVDLGMYDYSFNAEKFDDAIDAEMKGEMLLRR